MERLCAGHRGWFERQGRGGSCAKVFVQSEFNWLRLETDKLLNSKYDIETAQSRRLLEPSNSARRSTDWKLVLGVGQKRSSQPNSELDGGRDWVGSIKSFVCTQFATCAPIIGLMVCQSYRKTAFPIPRRWCVARGERKVRSTLPRPHTITYRW